MCNARTHSLFVVFGCLATFLVGVFLVAGGLHALDSRGFMEATHVVVADTTGDGDGVRIQLDLIINVIIVAGLTAILASTVGLVGACRHSKSLLCMYSVAAVVFGVLFLATGVGCFMMFETLGPKLREQVNQFCVSDSFPRLLTHLKEDYNDKHCGNLNAVPTVNLPSPPASAIVSRMLTSVSVAGPAIALDSVRRFLAAKPESATVTAAPEATKVATVDTTVPAEKVASPSPTQESKEAVAPAPARAVEAPVSTSCGSTCQARVKLLSRMGGCRTLRFMCTNHEHATSGNVASTEKEDSAVVRRFEFYLEVLIASLLGFGSFLLISMICTCCFIYTLGTGRQGKKGGHAMLKRLFCPCLRNKSSNYAHKRLRTQEGSDDDSDIE